jgi:hypothetical protein
MPLLDAIWIGMLAGPWYRQEIGHRMAAQFNPLSGAGRRECR